MKMRYGPPLYAGKMVYGVHGLGVTGAVIRANTGPGPGRTAEGLLYDDLDDSSDDTKVISIQVVDKPSAGRLRVWEDGSFIFDNAPNGSYTFTTRTKVSGVQVGSGLTTHNLNIGVAAVVGTAVGSRVAARSGAATAKGGAKAAAVGSRAAVRSDPAQARGGAKAVALGSHAAVRSGQAQAILALLGKAQGSRVAARSGVAQALVRQSVVASAVGSQAAVRSGQARVLIVTNIPTEPSRTVKVTLQRVFTLDEVEA